MLTRKPITPRMVGAGGKALWNDDREEEGRMSWEDAPKFALERYERKAMLVLEAALPADAIFLRRFAAYCLSTADIIDGGESKDAALSEAIRTVLRSTSEAQS